MEQEEGEYSDSAWLQKVQLPGQSLFAESACPVGPLTVVLTDELDLWQEANPNLPNIGGLLPEMQAAAACLEAAVLAAKGTFFMSSAYRSQNYQAHIKEVWDKWYKLKDNTSQECAALKTELTNHKNYHSLVKAPGGVGSGHPAQTAIDATITLPPGAPDLDAMGAACGLVRNVPGDHVHWSLIP